MRADKTSTDPQPPAMQEVGQAVRTARFGSQGLMATLRTTHPALKRDIAALMEEISGEIQHAASAEERQALLEIRAAVIQNVRGDEATPQPEYEPHRKVVRG